MRGRQGDQGLPDQEPPGGAGQPGGAGGQVWSVMPVSQDRIYVVPVLNF